MRLTRRVTSIQPSPTLAVLARAQELIAQGVDIIDFGPGEPDFDTPEIVRAAGKRAIDEGHTKYTNALGTPAIRDAVASKYRDAHGVSLKRDNIIIGTGGKQELFNILMALVDTGDEVIIPRPYWVSFPDQVTFAGGTPVFARTDPASHFRPTLSAIEREVTPRTRGVIINSPCNPTGAVILRKDLEEIVSFCSAREIFVLFDETYEFFVYDDAKHVSAIEWFDEYPETVIVVNSMSKTFSMTGWRLGFAVAHPQLISAVGKIQGHSTSNPSAISQFAAVAALSSGGAEIRRMYEAYVERRHWLVGAINRVRGFHCDPPDGAFYLFPNVSSLYGAPGVVDSTSFSNFLLEEARVSVVPGIAFGDDDCIRISYATSLDKLRQGVERIEQAVRKLA